MQRWLSMSGAVIVSAAAVLILLLLYLIFVYGCIFPIIYNEGCFF